MRAFRIVVGLLLCAGFLTGCGTSASNPANSFSPSAPPPPVTTANISVSPPATSTTTMRYGQTFDVTFQYQLGADVLNASIPLSNIVLNECLSEQPDTIMIATCRGKGIQGQSGSLTFNGVTLHDAYPENVVPTTTYVVGLLTVGSMTGSSGIPYDPKAPMLTNAYPIAKLPAQVLGTPQFLPKDINWTP